LRIQQQQTGQIYDLCDARLLHKNVLSLKLMDEGFFYPAFTEILSKEECESVVMKTNQLRFIHHCLKIKDDYHLHLFLNIFFSSDKMDNDSRMLMSTGLDEEGKTLLAKYYDQSETRRTIGFTIYPKSG
jgi:hypothetical protein